MIERHSNKAAGFVSFPIETADFIPSGEGGMFVKLVAVENHDIDSPDHFAKCCGANVYDVLQEPLVGDDKTESLNELNYVRPEDITAGLRARRALQEQHFPEVIDHQRRLSRPYLASIVLGSTGWSGIHRESGEKWHCTVDNLTPEGKQLYDQVSSLYPKADIHLLTFLDV